MIIKKITDLKLKDFMRNLIMFYKANIFNLVWFSPAIISFLIFIIWSVETAICRSFNITMQNSLWGDDVFKFLVIHILSIFYLLGYAIFLFIKKIKFQGLILIKNIILIPITLFISTILLNYFLQPLFMHLEFLLNKSFYNECKANALSERDGRIAYCRSYNVSLVSVKVVYNTTSDIRFGWDISSRESFISLGNGFYYIISSVGY